MTHSGPLRLHYAGVRRTVIIVTSQDTCRKQFDVCFRGISSTILDFRFTILDLTNAYARLRFHPNLKSKIVNRKCPLPSP